MIFTPTCNFAPSQICTSVPRMAQKMIITLSSNLAGVLLKTQGCALSTWMHDAFNISKKSCLLTLICFLFCPCSQTAKTRTAPLCHCNPHCGQRWNCIHAVHCYRSHSALSVCSAPPWLFRTLRVLLCKSTRERASKLRAQVADRENALESLNDRNTALLLIVSQRLKTYDSVLCCKQNKWVK